MSAASTLLLHGPGMPQEKPMHNNNYSYNIIGVAQKTYFNSNDIACDYTKIIMHMKWYISSDSSVASFYGV